MLIVTLQSHEARLKIEAELKDRKRNATSEKKIAWEQGDLRENAGFAEAKRDIALTNRRLAELGLDRPDLMIINPKEWTKIDMMGEPNAQIGAIITIRRDKSPTTEEFIIGGAWDGDLPTQPAGKPDRLPYTSPLAKLLIPHDVGFKGTLETNGQEITLVDARAPTQAEIDQLFGSTEKKKAAPDQEMSM